MTWKAKGKPLLVNQSVPIDTDEPTPEEIAGAQRNWGRMDPEVKAYLQMIDEAAHVLNQGDSGDPECEARLHELERQAAEMANELRKKGKLGTT